MKNFPIIKYVILFAIGILTGNFISFNIYITLILILLLLVFQTISLSKNKSFQTPVYFIVYLTGILFITNSIMNKTILSDNFIKEKGLIIFGEVKDAELDRSYELRYSVHVDSVQLNNKTYISQANFILRVRESRKRLDSLYAEIKPGNYIKAEGTYLKARGERNPGEYDLQRIYYYQNISGYFNVNDANNIKIINSSYNVCSNFIFVIRKVLDDNLNQLYTPQTAALLKGLLIADRSEIEPQVNQAFMDAGIIHILSISGLHITFIVLILYLLFAGFNFKIRSYLTLFCLILLMLITGNPIPVFRSVIMSSVVIIALLYNRSTNVYNSLAVSAFIILIINPFQLFDAGFQLSYSSILSILIIHPVIKEKLKLFSLNKYLEKFILFVFISIAAQLGTLPFTVYYFHKISLVSFITNIYAIPLSGIMIAVGFVSLIFSFIMPIGQIFAACNELLTFLFYKTLFFIEGLKFSVLWIKEFRVNDGIIFYIFLTVLVCSIKFIKNKTALIIIPSLLILNYFICYIIIHKPVLPSDKLSVIMIDVEQGDSFLIKFPDGKYAIIDAGNASAFKDNGEDVIYPLLNYLGISKIDYGFISHTDKDHYSGFISLIQRGLIKNIYKPALDTSSINDKELEAFLIKHKVKINYYDRDMIQEGSARLYIMNSIKDTSFLKTNNDRSGFIKLDYGRNSFLFTGDLQSKAEHFYLKENSAFLKSDVLKISHHGSRFGTTEDFIDAVKPEFCLISCGLKNPYKHPSDEVISRLNLNKEKIERTDLSGAVILTSDGNNIEKLKWR